MVSNINKEEDAYTFKKETQQRNTDADELQDFIQNIDGKAKAPAVDPMMEMGNNSGDPLGDISGINMNDSNIYHLDG